MDIQNTGGEESYLPRRKAWGRANLQAHRSWTPAHRLWEGTLLAAPASFLSFLLMSPPQPASQCGVAGSRVLSLTIEEEELSRSPPGRRKEVLRITQRTGAKHLAGDEAEG